MRLAASTPTQRIDVSFFGDPAHGDLGPQRYTALLNPDTAAYSTLDQYGGNNQTVRYEGAIGKRWLLEGSFARAANNLVEVPSVDQWSVTDDTVTPHQPSGGIGFYEVGNQSTNWQYGAKATNLIGRIRSATASLAEHLDYINTINRTGPTFTLPDGDADGNRRRDRDPAGPDLRARSTASSAPTRSNVRDTSQNYTSFFVQDTWKVGSHLTINPGSALRASAPHRHARRPVARQRMGAADRRDLGSRPARAR